jgi:CBS domain containing-hemolysin-like protein
LSTQDVLALALGVLSIYLAVIGRAFASYSRARLDQLLERTNDTSREARTSALMRTLDRDDAIMLSAYALRVVVNLALAAVVVIEYDPGIGMMLGGAALFLLFGDIVPKALATAFADGLIWHLGRPFRWSLMPVLWLGHAILHLNRAIQRLFNKVPETQEEELENRLLSIVSEAESDGVLAERTQDIIEGVFDLRDQRVSEIMTPRTDLFFIDITTPLEEVVELAHESGHSRIPVYEGTRDNIVGVFYAKDLLQHWNNPDRNKLALRQLVRKAFYVPETSRVSDLLVQMRGGQHMAVATDEYGGTAGVVTFEDILEEIVGEIRDEYDTGEE